MKGLACFKIVTKNCHKSLEYFQEGEYNDNLQKLQQITRIFNKWQTASLLLFIIRIRFGPRDQLLTMSATLDHFL